MHLKQMAYAICAAQQSGTAESTTHLCFVQSASQLVLLRPTEMRDCCAFNAAHSQQGALHCHVVEYVSCRRRSMLSQEV